MVHGHGCICSCLGPMIDAQMKCKLFYKEKFMIMYYATFTSHSIANVFLPSVYDAILVIRPSCHFRDSRVIKNYVSDQAQYYSELPFNDGYFSALSNPCCPYYSYSYHSLLLSSISNEIWDINERGIVFVRLEVFYYKMLFQLPCGWVK